jgi:hypothetical protein
MLKPASFAANEATIFLEVPNRWAAALIFGKNYEVNA